MQPLPLRLPSKPQSSGSIDNYVDGGDELFMPDKLFLFCNRGDPGGEALTWLTDMRTLYDLLSQEDR